MLVTTTHEIAGKRIVKTVGLVRGNTIRARHLGRDFMAGIKNMINGGAACTWVSRGVSDGTTQVISEV